MTINEYRKELKRMTDEELQEFNRTFGGGERSREERVAEFAHDPKHERRICQLLCLVTQEERMTQGSLWATRAAAVSAISAVTAIVLTLVNLSITSRANERQLALSATPEILVQPSEIVRGKIGEFDLRITNQSLADLQDIRIYEDYFVSQTLKGGPITCHRFGAFVTIPDSTIETLTRGETKTFQINFKSIIENMKLFMSNTKGHRMRIARLTVKFRRKLDGKEFSQAKAYIITGKGGGLLDSDDRGIPAFQGQPTFSDIKRVLGIPND